MQWLLCVCCHNCCRLKNSLWNQNVCVFCILWPILSIPPKCQEFWISGFSDNVHQIRILLCVQLNVAAASELLCEDLNMTLFDWSNVSWLMNPGLRTCRHVLLSFCFSWSWKCFSTPAVELTIDYIIGKCVSLTSFGIDVLLSLFKCQDCIKWCQLEVVFFQNYCLCTYDYFPFLGTCLQVYLICAWMMGAWTVQ